MQALQLTAPEMMELKDVDVPEIDPDEVLIRVAGAGLCHSDLHVLHMPDWPIYPMTLGHETAGHITRLGENVTGLSEGDAVLVMVVWACGICRACVDGRDNVCINRGGRSSMPPAPGLSTAHGGMADYIKANVQYVEPLGSLDPVAAAPLADAGLTPMHAINGARHRLNPGSTAVIIGVGGLGHVGLQILTATTAARIIAVDTSEQKLNIARQHGADEAMMSSDTTARRILEATEEYGADAVFDFVGAQPTVDLATQCIAPDGALRFVGLAGGSFTYQVQSDTDVLPWGVDVRRSYGGTRRDQREVLELARLGLVKVDVTSYPLADAHRAFEDLEAGRVPGRAVLVP